MKKMLTRSRSLAVPVLLASSAFALAQSLGEPVAEVWIGQPLSLTVPARFASEDSRDTCVQAEVFYGDTRLRPDQVRAAVIGPEGQRRVRITADAIVDEPVVRVAVRAGCGSSMTRSYTLLPDMPSEAVLARLLQAQQAPQLARAGAATPDGRPPRLPVAQRSGSPRMIPAVAREVAAPRLHTAQALRPAEPAPARPRLRLEAIEADAHALLRVSAQLSQPLDPGRRATAALLWQAISAEPQDLMRSAAALQKLEQELAQLRQTTGSTRSELAALRQRVDEARPWYVSPRAIQLLALLVLVTAVATLVFAWRSRRAAAMAPWYAGPDAAMPPPPAVPDAAEAAAAVATVAAVAAGMPPRPAERRAQTTVDASAWAESTTPDAQVVVANPPGEPQPPSGFISFDLPAVAANAPARRVATGMLRVETLAATFEEADFLSSLGLHSDAMDVLKTYLEDSTSPAPVAFYELMRLCAQAEDPAAVEAVQRRYAQVHGVAAPRLEQVTAPFGAESNPELATSLVRTWGTGEVTSLIEQALFDAPPAAGALTLAAARDLICLYDLAMALLTATDPAGHDADSHPLAPWAHAEDAHEAHAAAQACADDAGGHRFAIDIDLSAAPAPLLPQQPREPDPQELAARLRAEKDAAREAARAAAEAQARAEAEARARAQAEAEAAFSAAVASERAISRY